MTYQDNDTIQVSDTVLSSQLGDESVILDHHNGLYFGLEGVGSFVWEKIQESPMTVAEIKAAVSEEFDADEATIETDINALLKQLKEEQLIA